MPSTSSTSSFLSLSPPSFLARCLCSIGESKLTRIRGIPFPCPSLLPLSPRYSRSSKLNDCAIDRAYRKRIAFRASLDRSFGESSSLPVSLHFYATRTNERLRSPPRHSRTPLLSPFVLPFRSRGRIDEWYARLTTDPRLLNSAHLFFLPLVRNDATRGNARPSQQECKRLLAENETFRVGTEGFLVFPDSRNSPP